jgi:hypothetical protein
VLEANHPQSIKDLSSYFFAGRTEDLEYSSHIIEDSSMEEKTEVLEDNAHDSSQFINSVFRYTEGISAVDDDLSKGGKEFPIDNS